MKMTIRSEILQQRQLSLGDFLVLLMGMYNVDYQRTLDSLVKRKIVLRNVFNPLAMVMSDNTKATITGILLQSDDKVATSHINFDSLAQNLQSLYPTGMKSGTSYAWRGKTSEIAHKLMTLVSEHNFFFTEQEALAATKEYVSSFGDDKSKMRLLKYFILRTTHDGTDRGIDSPFMTIIENNR